MSKKMVAIAEFCDLNAAYLVRSRLEAEGIPVFLQNEQVTGLCDPGFFAGGGARLQVPTDEVERAMAILREIEPSGDRSIAASLPATKGYRNGLQWFGIMTGLSALIGLLIYMAQHNR